MITSFVSRIIYTYVIWQASTIRHNMAYVCNIPYSLLVHDLDEGQQL